MAINSNNKGKVGERELAIFLREHGYNEARRGQQFQGGSDSPDIVGCIPGVHIECKRTERLALYNAVDQARRDCGDAMPTVWHRCNNDRRKQSCRGEWLVVLSAEDFLKLVEKANATA